MKKVTLYYTVLCALALCCKFKVTEQAENPSIWNVTVWVEDKDPENNTIADLKYNEDGVLQVEAGQRIIFWVESRTIPNIFFSPVFNWDRFKSGSNRRILYTDIFDPSTHSASFGYFVNVGVNVSGWYHANDFSPEADPKSKFNSKTIFFSSDKSGKKFVQSGSTLRMKESAPRSIVPCIGTNANFSATLRIISPAHLRDDNVKSHYEPQAGFLLPQDKYDKSLFLARTFECVAGKEKVTVEFPKIDPQLDDPPTILMNESLNIPQCYVKKPTHLIVESFPCFDPQLCGFIHPSFYQPLPYLKWKFDECQNCTDISVPVKWHSTPNPVLRIRCHANDQVTEQDVVRGLDRIYYLSDQVPPEVAIQARVIARAGTQVTVGIEALGYLYISISDSSISFKNGTNQLLDPWQNERWGDRGIRIMEVIINWTEDMDKITFHAFQYPSMKMTNVSVDLRLAAGNLSGENMVNF